MATQAITGVILAGGLGRRMGGVDKGLQLLDGKPLVRHVAERLAPQVSQLLVNANRNQQTYAALGYRLFADLLPDFAGPLAGLHAGLSTATTPLLVTVPCDSPFLPNDLVRRLHDSLVAAHADLAVARTFDQPHPVFCLCRRELLPHLTAYLAAGGRKFDRWYSTLHAVEVPFDDEAAAFENINTIEALNRFETGSE